MFFSPKQRLQGWLGWNSKSMTVLWPSTWIIYLWVQDTFGPYATLLISLPLQGYVCPGILVTLSEGADVRVVQEAWSTHALATPPGYRIYRLGLSGGCSVTPFPQVSETQIQYNLKSVRKWTAKLQTQRSRIIEKFNFLLPLVALDGGHFVIVCSNLACDIFI